MSCLLPFQPKRSFRTTAPHAPHAPRSAQDLRQSIQGQGPAASTAGRRDHLGGRHGTGAVGPISGSVPFRLGSGCQLFAGVGRKDKRTLKKNN